MHAAFDEAGGGNMIEQLINAPLLDPTWERLGLKCSCLLDLQPGCAGHRADAGRSFKWGHLHFSKPKTQSDQAASLGTRWFCLVQQTPRRGHLRTAGASWGGFFSDHPPGTPAHPAGHLPRAGPLPQTLRAANWGKINLKG